MEDQARNLQGEDQVEDQRDHSVALVLKTWDNESRNFTSTRRQGRIYGVKNGGTCPRLLYRNYLVQNESIDNSRSIGKGVPLSINVETVRCSLNSFFMFSFIVVYILIFFYLVTSRIYHSSGLLFFFFVN